MEGQLPDTPWHIGYAKKDEDDPRRHKARCIHHKDGTCKSSRLQYYLQKCGGSSHCLVYSETFEDYQKKLEELKSVEELTRDNVDRYKASLHKKKIEITKLTNHYSYCSTDGIHKCLVCDSGLKKRKYSLKECSYCGMYYVNIQDYTKEEILNIVKADEVFLANLQKPKVERQHAIARIQRYNCKYMQKNSSCRCTCEDAKRYEKRCNGRCPYYEKRK